MENSLQKESNNSSTNTGAILIVDDQKANVTVLANILSQQGYDVGIAFNGIQAIQMISDKCPDLLLLDVMMPELDGFETCKRIRKIPTASGLPIIFLTARIDKTDVVKGFEVGGNDYVTKPFNAGELIARIETQLELKKPREQIIIQNNKLAEQNDQLEKYSKELTLLNANKDKYFSILSHDLRGPFQALLGISETALNNFSAFDKSQTLEMFSLINETASNLYSMMENLLAWSRLQMKKEQVAPQIFEVEELVRKVADGLKQNLLLKNISLEIQVSSDIKAYADSNSVRRVLHNLLNNAIKFSRAGEKIIISATSEANTTKIYVKDEGIGMSEDTLQKLFKIESSFSTLGTNDEEGSGLGLILCKELVASNRGSIAVKSEIGKGSNFIVTLPKEFQEND